MLSGIDTNTPYAKQCNALLAIVHTCLSDIEFTL
ncbi:hypothetical protein HMPREF1199_00314 [Hoylesella oralis CC98A]|nr:hypothetical protein HMPREF1199_00314 [Hoylesella oralis CC98A]